MSVTPGAATRVDGTAIERGGRELGTIAPATQTATGRQAAGSSTASPLTTGVESREGAPARAPAGAAARVPAGAAAGAGTGTSLSEPLYGVHVVKSGEYLGKIAQMYGTTVATLREINGISGSLIEVDQQIRYPLPAN
ncbi:MAG: LysM peptidoglycan-binding domain-containing protein [Granulosicoccus sp.]|nr:LysM peptidoglycan-binding domain-containing protein [Granulosicoccus sp.]